MRYKKGKGARARISPFWLRLRVAAVLGVHTVRLRGPLAFGFAKMAISVARATWASLRSPAGCEWAIGRDLTSAETMGELTILCPPWYSSFIAFGRVLFQTIIR
jgi:hypothetical protein